MRWILVPHAETEWNEQRRYQGHSDPPLSERGRAAACRLAVGLKAVRGPIVASDLRRAVETAQALGRPMRTDARLRELNFGAFEGRTYDELCAMYHDQVNAWLADSYHVAPPGGESLRELEARLRSWFAEASRLELPADEALILVAHRGSLRALLCLALDLPVDRHWMFTIEMHSMTELDLGPPARLLRLNVPVNVSHDNHPG